MLEHVIKRSCWLEIDLDCIKNNFEVFKKMVGSGIQVMPAVKANGYSHGIIESCKELERCGANYLGLGSIDEAILLRENGVKTPLLIFASNTVSEVADLYIEYNLIPTIQTKEQAKSISCAAKAKGSIHPIFTKIETGRGRLGVNAEEFPDFIKEIVTLQNIRIEGVYSHMSDANWPDKEIDYSAWQYKRFQSAVDKLSAEGIEIPFRQLTNTPGSIAYPQMRMTGVCPGRAIWGYSPLEKRPEHPELKNALVAWKSRLILVKEVMGGKFGENFKTVKLDKPKRIGIIVGGQYDGISSRQAKGGYVLIRGKKVPVASPISLEHTTVDLTDCPEAQIGDEVVIMGRQGDEEITRDSLLTLWNKNLIEFWVGLNPHLTRIYYRNGKMHSIAYGDIVKGIN